MCHIVSTPPLKTLSLDGSANRSGGAQLRPLVDNVFTGIAIHGAEILYTEHFSITKLIKFLQRL